MIPGCIEHLPTPRSPGFTNSPSSSKYNSVTQNRNQFILVTMKKYLYLRNFLFRAKSHNKKNVLKRRWKSPPNKPILKNVKVFYRFSLFSFAVSTSSEEDWIFSPPTFQSNLIPSASHTIFSGVFSFFLSPPFAK
jgi:hypothetical protein